jgi:type IV pilus assembly protein PilB
VIPIQRAERTLVVAFADPTNIHVRNDISIITKCKVEVVVASEGMIKYAIEKYFASTSMLKSISEEMENEDDAFLVEAMNFSSLDLGSGADSEPIIKFVNAMLVEAIQARASDIHIEPYEKRFRIRYRIDGTLMEKSQPPLGAAGAITTIIKILSKMDIAERRRPQDGRIKVKLKKGKPIDFRVSCIPTLFGEKIVLRILDQSALQVDLAKLGFEQEDLEELRRCMNLPQGLILLTGPTGSGKTTTIYSALSELNSISKNISTAENPVEYNIEGINQVQINSEIGFDFPAALRSFLRQDPEIIMVGEIRDLETAQMAFKAASTGHLVVSTLHTNDSTSTITRLVDMGIPSYLVAETITLVIAQRLLKTNCKKCLVDYKPERQTLVELGIPENEMSDFVVIKKGKGCEYCNYSGFFGREAVYEVLKMTTSVKEAILKGTSKNTIKSELIKKGELKTLRHKALTKLKLGITTIEQVLNVTLGDDFSD